MKPADLRSTYEKKSNMNGKEVSKDDGKGALHLTAKNFKNANLDILEFEAPSNCQAWENQVT